MERYEESLHIFISSIVLIPVYALSKTGKIIKAATYLLIFIVANCTYFMWKNYGVLDEAVYFYPSVLIMAAMVGNKRLFLSLTIFILVSISLNGLLNVQGLYINNQPSIDISGTILLIFFITLTAYISWVMTSDFIALLRKLKAENNEVINSKKEIEKLIFHDALTGLPNRVMARDTFLRAKFRAQNNNLMVGVLFIDIDNFKCINDELGHETGDFLLKEITNRLSKTIQDSDSLSLLCRLAGDEFIIIVESVQTNEILAKLAQEVLFIIQKPVCYNKSEFSCTSSIGISVTPNDSEEYDTIIRNAGKAMHISKSTGGNSFHFFDDEMDKQSHEYLVIVNDLRKAITDNQFILTYQPKVNLATNQVYGAEALIRWIHPDKGIISPDSFIPQAEKSGLIIEIGDWVLNQACKTCKSWVDLGLDLTIAVNVSSKQFTREGFYESVKKALHTSQLCANRLELEMTESLIIDNTDKLQASFESLRNLGVKFSIDDFGTGYSNLGYLKEFEIEYLKIDRSFIFDLESNPQNKVLVKAIIQLSHGLEIEAIGEGIEDQMTADMLVSLNCNYAQGYFWSKPLIDSEFIDFVKSYSEKQPIY